MNSGTDLERLRVNMQAQNATRVGSLADVIRTLRSQGAVVDIEDLQPELLGLNGYIGTRVLFRDQRTERIWVRGIDVIQSTYAPDNADVAEWLTMTLANPKSPYMAVKDIIRGYLKMDIARNWPPMLRASLLSHAATKLGFLFDPLATKLWLPLDHPLAQRIILPTDYEVARYSNPRRRPAVQSR